MILAARPDRATMRAHDIAQEAGIPEKFLKSILLELKNGRMIESILGAKGGYKLRRDPGELCLGEIIRLVDGSRTPFDGADFFSKGSSSDWRHHTLHQVFRGLNDASERILNNTTLADLVPAPVCARPYTPCKSV